MKIRIITEPFEHNYEPVKKGTIVEVDDKTGEKVIADGYAERVDAAASAASAPAPARA